MTPRSQEETLPQIPTEMLMSFVLGLLSPLFGDAGVSELRVARLMAIEMLSAYRIRHADDLLLAAKIVAFSVATVKVLALSMKVDLPPETLLRLHRNANALTRSGDRCRVALGKAGPPERVRAVAPLSAEDRALREAEVKEAVAQARRMVDDAKRRAGAEVASLDISARPTAVGGASGDSAQPLRPNAVPETIAAAAPVAATAATLPATGEAVADRGGPVSMKNVMPAPVAKSGAARAAAVPAGQRLAPAAAGTAGAGARRDAALVAARDSNVHVKGLAVPAGAPEPTEAQWQNAYMDAFAEIAGECAALRPDMTEAEMADSMAQAEALAESVAMMMAGLTPAR